MNRLTADAILAELTQLMLSGNLADVEARCTQLLEQTPGDPRLLCLLGRSQRLQGKYGSARRHLETASRLAPKAAQVASELGYLAVAEENYTEAESYFGNLSRLMPQLPDAWFNLGVARRQQGNHAGAIEALENALRLEQSRPEQVLAELGTVHIMQRDETTALDYFKQALTANPDYAPALYGVGMVRSAFGAFDEAAAFFRRALESDPDFFEAYQQLVSIQRYDETTDPEILQMTAVANDPNRHPLTREALHFALGKVHDDTGQHEAAFRHFSVANQLKRDRLPHFSRESFSTFIDQMIDTFPVSHSPAYQSESALPLLIFGMPRSGTTLVEQITASHSLVTASGEQSFIDRESRTQLAPYPRSFWSQPRETLQPFCSQYLTRLDAHREPGARHVTDKLPANFLHIGLVNALFPNAPLVYCRRNRLDNLLSIYFQSMPGGHHYANDLHEINFYYREHERLMQHWQSVLGDKILVVDYEELIADFDNQVRRLINHCNLPWEEACLDHRSRKGPVATLSLWQVRQPIYNRSVDRWRQYESWLPDDLLS